MVVDSLCGEARPSYELIVGNGFGPSGGNGTVGCGMEILEELGFGGGMVGIVDAMDWACGWLLETGWACAEGQEP
jgi:hypothetical protein